MTETVDFVLAKRYRLLQALGHGAMGTVWRAHDELLERDVAIKEIRFPAELDDADRVVFYRRTLREARAPARVRHKSIIEVYDVVQEHARPWIVMELIEAPTLEQHIKEHGPLRPDEAAGIGRQLVAALAEAHASGVLHRDIKPSNVLLAPGRVVLTDFGLAITNGSSTITKVGTFVGSPAYVAPEVARGEKATPESDLWSLGATLYCAVEGRPPFDHESVMATLSAVLTEDPNPSQRSGELGPIINGLLQRNPRRRLTHARLAERLDRAATPKRSAGQTPGESMVNALSSAGLPSRRSGAHRAKQSRQGDLRPLLFGGLGVLAVGIVIAVIIGLSGGDEPAGPSVADPTGDVGTSVSATTDVLVVKAEGGACKLTIMSGGVGGAAADVQNTTIPDGQLFRSNKVPMDVTVSDGQVCKVTVNGEAKPAAQGEQTYVDIDRG
ncbi:serine/threonine-protein kinase [Actinocorallia sp. A-T 12471]|uniref:serine/threonine-protein kinase n=1 Tax=Actinocorallia sp. A-T 12471 TaxID=3089813 RepID=UPI0029CFF5B8|nr:serine/threonine-protein kinase [Actinocorallia sp. A-T 12471]MDX6738588.1 serine/threonine-protein kinase [Actinocorallia sp. A-T 12471]